MIVPNLGIMMSHTKLCLDSCKRRGDEIGCLSRMIDVTQEVVACDPRGVVSNLGPIIRAVGECI